MLGWHFPWALVLLPLPLLVYFLLPPARKTNTDALYVPTLTPFTRAQQSNSAHITHRYQSSNRRIWFTALIWSLLIIAALQPQWVGKPLQLPVSGRDLMLAVDLSGSMGTQDMRIQQQIVNRLQAVKSVLSEFIHKRQGDRMGLVLFADHAYVQTPLTHDSKTIQSMLNQARLGLVGKKTSIGEAIALVIKQLKDLPLEGSQSRVMILLTDGANTTGIDPLKMARLAQKLGIKIYTIGIGADQILVNGFFGQRLVNPSSDLDEATLQQIAKITGGVYFRARDVKNLQQIYEQINQLEPIDSDKKFYRPVQPLFYYPLGLAFVITLIWAATAFLREQTGKILVNDKTRVHTHG